MNLQKKKNIFKFKNRNQGKLKLITIILCLFFIVPFIVNFINFDSPSMKNVNSEGLETNDSTYTITVTDPAPYFTKGSYSGHPEYWHSYNHEGHEYIWTYIGGMEYDPYQPDCWAEYRPYLPQSGSYEVYASFYADPQNSHEVPYTVYYNGGSTTIDVDQYAPAYFTWKRVKLGTWNFITGSSTKVVITDANGNAYDGSTTLNADTIEFVSLVNNAPYIPTSLDQYKSDGYTTIPEGGTNNEDSMLLKAYLSDPDGDDVYLEIELRQFNEVFQNQPTGETISGPHPSGSTISISRGWLSNAAYHWQARARDSKGAYSDWIEFGNPGNIDFYINVQANNPPSEPYYLQQFKSDWTPIPEGETTNEDSVRFQADIFDPDGDDVFLEIELRQVSEGLRGEPTMMTSSPYPSGSRVMLDRGYLVDADYLWQARVRDINGAYSNWVQFGIPNYPDFTVDSQPLYFNIQSDYDWHVLAETSSWCTGTGTIEDPYILGHFTIDASTLNYGILIENTNIHFIIEWINIFNAQDAAIRLQNVRNGRIYRNELTHNNIGIDIIESQEITIVDNDISYNDDCGLDMTFGQHNSIYQNVVSHNNGWGMFIYECDDINVINNTVNQNSQVGILVESDLDVTESNVISYNHVKYNGWNGIYLERCMDSEISRNLLTENNEGLRLVESNNNLVYKNIIDDNYGWGLGVIGSNGNIFYLNSFSGNYDQVYIQNSDNFWNSQEPITYYYADQTYTGYIGNYWDAYSGDPSNGNGIGDIAYSFDGEYDYYPLIEIGKKYFKSTNIPSLFNGLYFIGTSEMSYQSSITAEVHYSDLGDDLYRADITSNMGDGAYEIHHKTRLIHYSEGAFNFGTGVHAPFWIFPDVKLGETVLFAVDGDGDHLFRVSGESTYTFDGNDLEVWVLDDLSLPGGYVYFEKNTGLMVYGMQYFGGGVYNYTFWITETNAQFSVVIPDDYFPERIRIYRTATGQIEVVDFKYYVKNVLPNEWAACWDWDIEALKAGATTIKTYAWYRILNPKYPGQGYDVRDDEWDQVYDPDWKNKFILATPEDRYENAVEATWNALIMKNNEIFEAQYDSGTPGSPDPLIPGRMSQWGTLYWALQEKDWQWIIKYYYDPVEIMQFSVYAMELSYSWKSDPITSLPFYESTLEYYILNLGSEEINDLELKIKVNGDIIDHSTISSIKKGEANIDIITIDIIYDTSKTIEITVSKGPLNETFTDVIYASLTRAPNYGNFEEHSKLFITPKDPLVQETLNIILENYPSPMPEWMAIRDWVGSSVSYNPKEDYDKFHYDVDEYWQLPRETIQKKLGDCEDYALLLVSLLRANGWDPNEVYVVVGYKIIEVNGVKKEAWHAWVRIKIGPIWYNIEPQGDALLTLIGDYFVLNEFNAVYMFNDIKFEEIGYVVKAYSPVDLVIVDPNGFTISKYINEIPNAVYYELDLDGDGDLDDQIRIPEKILGEYQIYVIPDENADPSDIYSLELSDNGNNYIIANNVKILNIPQEPYILKSTDSETIPIIPANIDFDPNTLNIKSKGKWVTVYIELPVGHDYNIYDINLLTIMLNGEIYAELSPFEIGDYDNDGVCDLMVKFDRTEVINLLPVGDEVEITISGNLVDGRFFKGTDTIRVKAKGKKNDISLLMLSTMLISMISISLINKKFGIPVVT